ncbi:MAG: hypothetical protein O2807_11735 [bacterium]|nr:hypothetical protein [bacterium]
MVNIHSIQPGGGPGGVDPSQGGKKSRPEKGANSPAFADFLDAAKSGSQKGGADAPQKAGGPATPPAAYLGRVTSAIATGKQKVIGIGEEFFKLVESFRRELGNPEASLKDIAPLLHNMELYRDKMLDEVKEMPEGNPGRKLIEEMAALVSTESAKFNRGDFV